MNERFKLFKDIPWEEDEYLLLKCLYYKDKLIRFHYYTLDVYMIQPYYYVYNWRNIKTSYSDIAIMKIKKNYKTCDISKIKESFESVMDEKNITLEKIYNYLEITKCLR